MCRPRELALPLLTLLFGCRNAQPTQQTWTAPAGSPFVSATVATGFKQSGGAGWRDSKTHKVVFHQLMLKPAHGELVQLSLYEASEQDSAAFAREKARSWRGKFSADGQALALSSDAGARWSLVCLNAGEPFFCPHGLFGTAEDPFQGAPTTRALMLEILASSTAKGAVTGRNHANHTWDPAVSATAASLERRKVDLFLREMKAAVNWVKHNEADAGVRQAFAAALRLPGIQLNDTDALAVATHLAVSYPDFAEDIESAAAGPHSAYAVQALEAAAGRGPILVSLLKRALDEDFPAGVAVYTWGVTHRLVRGADAEGAEPLLRRVLALDPKRDRSTRVSMTMALKGLRALGASLDAFAGPCERYQVSAKNADFIKMEDDPVMRPAWTPEIGSYQDAMGELSWYSIGCQVSAAQRHTGPRPEKGLGTDPPEPK